MIEAYQDIALLIARVTLGILFIVHGKPKMFGKPGIIGFGNWLRKQGYPVPFLNALLVAITEFVGGIFLILGLFTELVALFMALVMVVAVYHNIKKEKKPFKGGWELDLLIITLCLLLMTFGGGVYVLESYLKLW